MGESEKDSLPLYYIILALFMAFFGVVGNGMVFFLICSRRRLQVVGNYFVASLAAADLLVGLFLPSFFIVCNVWSACDIVTYNMFFNLFTLVSIASLFVMTVDRYISIIFPFRYPSHATTTRIFAAITASWVLPALFSFSPLFWMFSSSEYVKTTAKKVHAFIVITTFEVVPTVVMPTMYAHIFRTARRHARQVEAHKTQLEYNSTHSEVPKRTVNLVNLEMLTTTGKKMSSASQAPASAGERKPDGSSIAVLGSVIGLFVLCWSFDTVISFCNKLELCVTNDHLFRVADLMIFLNSAINPLVYALLKKDIKKELRSLCIGIRNKGTKESA